MAEVTVTRSIDAPPAAVREAIQNHEAFTLAAGFDTVTIEGDRIAVTKQVGLFGMELTVELVDDPEATVAYEAREGIFDAMRTEYTVAPADGGSRVTARTTFEMDVKYVGPLLDATVVKRQRRKELEAQLDWLDATVG